MRVFLSCFRHPLAADRFLERNRVLAWNQRNIHSCSESGIVHFSEDQKFGLAMAVLDT